jgi:exopolysaccharide biosynthesis WecB/TagA/CpsF family protein
MIDKGKVAILGVRIDAVDYEAAAARIIDAAKAGQPYAVSALAVHGVMEGVDDAEHLERLNRFQMITPDGQPVRWAMNWLHDTGLPDRVYGPRLTLDVCRAAAAEGLPVYFYGSTQDTLDHLASRLPELAPGIEIAGMQPSRFRTASEEELDAIAEEVRSTGAKICMVGLGCPRQEVFAYENAERMSMPLMAVGAAFDFHAGLATEPPAWVQRAGLQWAQRLVANPKRLWRRYLILNPRYVAGIIRQRFGRNTSPTTGHPPTHVGHS